MPVVTRFPNLISMKKLEISVLDLAPVKKNKTLNDTFNDSLSLAKAVEKIKL